MNVNREWFILAVLCTGLVLMLAYFRLDDRIAQVEHVVYSGEMQP